MTQLLEDKDYVNLGATELLDKAAKEIKKREEVEEKKKNKMKKILGRCPECGILWERKDMMCPNCKIPLKPEECQVVYNPR